MVVASMLAGGERQLSQLPQTGGGFSPKWRSRTARRQPAVSTSAPSDEMRVPFSGLPGQLDLGDALARPDEVFRSPEQGRDRRVAVASGAAALLIIALDRLGQAGMDDEAHVRLVDPHAEGNRRDHHHLLAGEEGGLIGGADLRGRARHDKAGRGACHPGAGQRLGELLGGGAGLRIDDAGAGLLGEDVADLALEAVARLHRVADIGAVEARDDQAVGRNAELGEDVLAGVPVGGGGERQARYSGEGVEQRAQQAIVGPEVMTPFGYAMRFVDGEERNPRSLQQAAETLATRAFRRHVEQIQFARDEAVLRLAPVGVDRGEARRPNPQCCAPSAAGRASTR